jgi:signal transduction histidine kinase
MIGRAMRQPTLADAAQEAIARLRRIEYALGRLPEGPERDPLAGDVTALREALERLEGLERDERHQMGHDLRVPLNTIAGWTHILRLDAATPTTVQRAVDVFERNVRALTRLIETYTADPRH